MVIGLKAFLFLVIRFIREKHHGFILGNFFVSSFRILNFSVLTKQTIIYR